MFEPTASQAFATDTDAETLSSSRAQAFPSKRCIGPVRGSIGGLRPGTYVLAWKSQPGRRSRPQKLRRRCWLQSDQGHPLGPIVNSVIGSDTWLDTAPARAFDGGGIEASAAGTAALGQDAQADCDMRFVDDDREGCDTDADTDARTDGWISAADASTKLDGLMPATTEAAAAHDDYTSTTAGDSDAALASASTSGPTEPERGALTREQTIGACDSGRDDTVEDLGRSVPTADMQTHSWCWGVALCAGISVGVLTSCGRLLVMRCGAVYTVR